MLVLVVDSRVVDRVVDSTLAVGLLMATPVLVLVKVLRLQPLCMEGTALSGFVPRREIGRAHV